MAQACTICNHPLRNEIEKEALTPNRSKTAIGRKYGCGADSIKYHIDNHLSPAIIKETSLIERLQIDALLCEIEDCLNRAKQIRDNPKYANKPSLILQANREIKGVVGMMIGFGLEMKKIQQAQDVQEQQNGRVIEVPVITDDMSARQAESLWKNYLLQLKLGSGSVIVLPKKEEILTGNEQDQSIISDTTQPDNFSPPTRTKRTRLPVEPEEEPIVFEEEIEPEPDDLSEDERQINEILSWVPSPAPERKPIRINKRPI